MMTRRNDVAASYMSQRNRRSIMRTNARWRRMLVALGMLLALTGITTPSAGAVVGGYVEIHSRACPPGYTGDAYFEDCHDTPLAGGTFAASGPGLSQEAVTNAEGVVVFGDVLEAGTVTITETVPSGDYAEYVVYCSRADNQAPVPFAYGGDGRAVTFEMPADIAEAGGGIVCDWYNIPAAPSDGEELIGTLELVKLDCEGQTATEIIVFTPLDVAGGVAEAGHDQCRGATASFQIIPYGDQTLDPIGFDAEVGVNELTLPVGDHTLVEAETGATATFPIEELATSRVYVLNPESASDGTIPPTEAPARPSDLVTTLPSTGTGSADAGRRSVALAAVAGVLAFMATGVAYATRQHIER